MALSLIGQSYTKERQCRIDEAHKLLDEVANLLTEMRRTMLGAGNRPS